MDYIKGIIGGIIGGIVAAIPWILMYIYGNMLVSILAAIIAFGVNYGYRLLKGKVDTKLPLIITIISLVIVIVVTTVIVPLLLLGKEGYNASIANLQILYQNSEYVSAVARDLVISIVFTILGISGIVRKIKAEVAE